MRKCALFLVILCGAVFAGCNPDLGECDEAAAREVVYDDCGTPMYAGQALMQVSCGNGSYCHSERATGTFRNGAPAGLNWDVAHANTVDNQENPNGSLDRLRRGQRKIFEERELIWTMVEGEVMPPFGDAADVVLENRRSFEFADGRTLELIETEAARDRLRNWLACGAPVVERSVPIRDATGAIVPTEVGSVVPPVPSDIRVDPTFTSIYDRILLVRCRNCHQPASAYSGVNNLDMSDATTAYANLFETPAMGERLPGSSFEACAGAARTRVVPGDPDGSLLYEKVFGTPSCGAQMPLNETPLCAPQIAAIRDWIEAGASP